ncbi:MAG TPA: DUF3515 domain-containing protein [Nocardioidaceae bacterium]|nr:DUF3515 domain-containing protein [Nocardioidaceae bacterium]
MLLAGWLLAGCAASSAPVAVTPPTPAGVAARDCRALLAGLPSSVGGQPRRDVSPSDALAAAWGAPPIVLRCGVRRPASLRPTSACPTVDGVGWLARRQASGWVFTTIGRSAYVEVTVPRRYAPAGDALADLAGAIKRHTAYRHPCR